MKKPDEQITSKDLTNWKAALNILKADILLIRAMSQFQLKSYLSGAWNMRKSWKLSESILQEHCDAETGDSKTLDLDVELNLKCGVGMFLFIMGLIPQGVITKALSVVGFVSDSEKGIKFLEDVYAKDGLKAAFSAILLGFTYLMLPTALDDYKENLKKVKPIIEFSKEKYPKSTFFNFLGSKYEQKSGDFEKAIEYLDSAIKSCEQKNVKPNMYKWEKGNCFICQLDFESAINTMKLFEDDEIDFEHKTIVNLQLACCYHLTGDTKKSIELLKKIPNMCKKKRYDDLCLKKSKEILSDEKTMSFKLYLNVFELLYFRRDIAHMKKDDLTKVNKHLAKLFNDDLIKNDVVSKIGLKCLEASVYNGLEEKEKSIKSFEDALKIIDEGKIPKEGHHWCVAAYYDLGEIFFRDGKLKEAENYLKKASSYSGYFWSEIYASRISKALKQLKKEMKKNK